MSARQPAAVYLAANSLEAHFLCGLLTNCGIEAVVIEGLSHEDDPKPTIWIDRADLERARPIFADFQQRLMERRLAESQSHPTASEQSLLVTCEDCGRESVFPAAQYGLVQNCPQCNAYVDVGEVSFDDWDVTPE